MDRGKHGMGPGKRGGKSKSVAHVHGDLIALGAKGSGLDSKHAGSSQHKAGLSGLLKQDKKLDASGAGLLKKSKSGGLGVGGGSGAGSGSDRHVASSASSLSSRPELDAWQSVAADPPASYDLIAVVMDADPDRAEAMLCGCVRQLSAQRAKPDALMSVGLLLLAKSYPVAFCSEHVIAAFCSLLRRDAAASFKSKGNPQVQVLAANLLLAVFRDEGQWPELFVRVYLEDAAGDRLWVDSDECRLFVDNVVTAFGTRSPPRHMLQPDITLSVRTPECPSPPTAAAGSSAAGEDQPMEDSLVVAVSADSKDAAKPRYDRQVERIREVVLDYVKELIGTRKQPIEAVSRNILRLLASLSGIPDVRQCVVYRLEVWLQNPKWSRPAQELLVSLCSNLTSPELHDVEVISQLVRFRLKAKPIINLYLNCMRELLAAHTDNLSALLKHTIYNELSQARNPHNMAVLATVFQHSPHQAATALAEVFLELLMNKEDYYLRALRPLWREICRSLRYEVDFHRFCSGLLQERRDEAFREFEFRERYVTSICDLISLSILLSISATVKEAASTRPVDRKDHSVMVAFQKQVALVQREVLQWLHVSVPDMVSKGWSELSHCVYKVLFMEPTETYHRHDNWPPESERAMMIRIASDVPAAQDSLLRVLLIGLSKTHSLQPTNALEVVENMVRRSAMCHLQTDGKSTLAVDKLDIVDLLFNLSMYQHPEGMTLPEGYKSPQLAIQDSYWRVWFILLLITAHNPQQFGKVAWQHYHTLRMMIEMCITNSFRFPPPTMATGDRADELLAKELQQCSMEARKILEYESHLAAASTGQTITEANSLLLSQLIGLEPDGAARRPPPAILEQLSQLNGSLRLGQLLCTSRQPDFLLDILHRQGSNQSMPWLSELVTNNEGAFSVLPVQCLCEFLLTQSGRSEDMTDEAGRPAPVMVRHRQLLTHLQQLVREPSSDQRANVELVEYFLRRLSSPRRQSRVQAARGFQLVLQPPDQPRHGSEEQPYSWLQRHFPAVPNFGHLRQGAVHGLRIACHYETDPGLVGAYIQFLATHGSVDPLPELTETVVDLSQLIVERSNIMTALLPAPGVRSTVVTHTFAALLNIFSHYMQLLKQTGRVYNWSDSPEQVIVRWTSGETFAINTLVVHASVILLCCPPGNPPSKEFSLLQELWFPARGPAPQTLDNSPLQPDWLKLRMVRGFNPRLVNAALNDLQPAQLVLFIQSFGVPVASMTKLLTALDSAVEHERAGVVGAVMNKEYMAQLVVVQHQRGAKGGHKFAAILRADSETPAVEERLTVPLSVRQSPVSTSRPVTALAPSQVLWYVRDLFAPMSELSQQQHQLRSLQRGIALESHETAPRLVTRAAISVFRQLLEGQEQHQFLQLMRARLAAACCLLRLLTAVVRPNDGCSLSVDLLHVCRLIVEQSTAASSDAGASKTLVDVCQSYQSRCSARGLDMAMDTTSDISTKMFSNEKKLAKFISSVPASDVETTLRRLVDDSVAQNSTGRLVASISQCLQQFNTGCALNPADSGRVGLLIDWIELLEPDIISSCPEVQRQMLFAVPRFPSSLAAVSEKRSVNLNHRAYLLALLTHRSGWSRLQETIDVLLSVTDGRYESSVVLDFLWACRHVPRLWQGRDKAGPRRFEDALVLKLDERQVATLAEYIVREASLVNADVGGGERSMRQSQQHDLPAARLPLLLLCIGEGAVRCQLLSSVVSKLVALSGATELPSQARNSADRLLLELYLKLPRVVAQLDNQPKLFTSLMLDSGGVSVLDSLSHTLLTAVAATRTGKDWSSRMRDFEIPLRKMAATHPLLFLRQLPMMASLLRGRMHVESPVFRRRNDHQLFGKLLGLLELLQPHLFMAQHRSALTDLLSSFLETLRRHQARDIATTLLPRLVQLLQNFARHAPSDACQLLRQHSPLLAALTDRHPDQRPALRALAAFSAGGADETRGGASSCPPLLATGVSAAAAASPAQLSALMVRLNAAASSDERAAVLQDLDAVSQRCVTLLEHFVDDLCDLLSSCSTGVRQLAHQLLMRHLHQAPAAAARCVPAYMECLDSRDECVRVMVLERLADIVVLAQEHACPLLQKAFSVGLTTGANTAQHIAEALSLLNVQTGA